MSIQADQLKYWPKCWQGKNSGEEGERSIRSKGIKIQIQTFSSKKWENCKGRRIKNKNLKHFKLEFEEIKQKILSINWIIELKVKTKGKEKEKKIPEILLQLGTQSKVQQLFLSHVDSSKFFFFTCLIFKCT